MKNIKKIYVIFRHITVQARHTQRVRGEAQVEPVLLAQVVERRRLPLRHTQPGHLVRAQDPQALRRPRAVQKPGASAQDRLRRGGARQHRVLFKQLFLFV